MAEINKLGVGRHLFRHSSIIYKDQSGTFQNQDKYLMPQGHFKISGTPVAMFYKQRGELQPTVLQDDHVEVSLTPNQEVDAGQVVLTFQMSEESVVPKVIRQENSNFKVDSSDLSKPINSVKIAAVDTGLDIGHT